MHARFRVDIIMHANCISTYIQRKKLKNCDMKCVISCMTIWLRKLEPHVANLVGNMLHMKIGIPIITLGSRRHEIFNNFSSAFFEDA
jgi:hypothetical protein